jgi:hypothetical protein
MKKLITTLMLITLLSFKVANNRSVYNIPLKASAVCAADQDLDGDMDIFTEHIIDSETNWGGTYILQNDGYGHFTFMDSIYYSTGMHDVYADTVFNSIYPDIISGNGEYVNFLSYDGENYTQKRFFMGTHINKFDIGDIDNNGHLDVVFISNQERYWGIIYNQGDGSFTSPENYDLDYPPNDIACGNLNEDGRCDVVVGGASAICTIYISTTTGFNMIPLQYNATNIEIVDMDNDGDNDIISFADTYVMSFVHMYENLGNNVFDTVNNFNISEGIAGIFVTDFNNDSLPDILFTAYFNNGGYLLYYNNGNFQFAEPQYIDLEYYMEAWRSTYCADMDGNTYTDIIVTRQSVDTAYIPSILEILFNDGQGNFVDDPLTSVENETITKAETNFINYPNPFKNNTTFEFTINKTSHIEISVYNLQGKLMKSLTHKNMKGGIHQIKWGGLNNASQACKPGPYIAYLKVNGLLIQSIKLIIN